MEVPMVTDPVCGMTVDENTAPAQSNYKGKTYYFCAQSCKEKFDADPDRFAKPQAGAMR
jgi:YHS domain-containing protein